MASKYKKTANTNIKHLYLVLILVVASLFILPKLFKNISTTTNKFGGTTKTNGVNTNPVAIKIREVNSAWEANGIAYQVKKVYLTPDIADIGDWRNNYEIGTKNQFAIVEIDVRDRRTSGSRKLINTTPYLRVKTGEIESAPQDSDYLSLEPQQDGKVFRIFVVGLDTDKFSLISGPTSRPKVTEIDFEEKSTTTMNGFFLNRFGYSATYTK